jgi:hypothetical protein
VRFEIREFTPAQLTGLTVERSAERPSDLEDKMHVDEHTGKRIRLHKDASYGQRLAAYLTEEQVAEGPEGEIIRSGLEDGELIFYVKLDNVPDESRFVANECRIL